MDMLKKYLYLGLIISVLSIGGYIYYKVNSYIGELQDTITIKEVEVKKYLDKYNDSQRDLALSESNVVVLTTKLDAINIETNTVKAKLDLKLKELEEWRAKPVEVKYVEKVRNIVTGNNKSCEDGLKLMQSISNLKYEEL